MTISTFAPVAATREAALAALEPARAIYTGWGYTPDVEEQLVTMLTTVPTPEYATTPEELAEELAEAFRNYLWSYFPGGGTSASVTHKVFGALGRGKACSPDWI